MLIGGELVESIPTCSMEMRYSPVSESRKSCLLERIERYDVVRHKCGGLTRQYVEGLSE